MIKHFFITGLLFVAMQPVIAQGKLGADKYKPGYALKGTDTIRCQVLFNSKYADARSSVGLLIDGDEAVFFAGGPITGFGAEDDGLRYDYGIVDVEITLGRERRSNLLYLKKLAAGTINLYEYNYKITTTRRTTVNGEEKPGSASTTSQSYTDYYIAKTDSAKPVLATPVLLSAFRKKDLEAYLGDNPVLFAKEEKKYSLKELVATIKEYNAGY